MKTKANPNNFIIKMINEDSSTNPESFNGFGRGRRMDLATSHGNTFILSFRVYYTPTPKLDRKNGPQKTEFRSIAIYRVS
jgi:hypothetical protein